MSDHTTQYDTDWEYQNDVDRRLALVVFWPFGEVEYRHLGNNLHDEIRDAVASELNGYLPDDDLDEITINRYQIGPTAEWFPTYLVTLYRDIQPFISDGANLIEWAGAIVVAVKAVRRWRNRIVKRLPDGTNVSFTEAFSEPLLSTPAIEALCFRHFRESHHPRAEVAVSTSARSSYEPYGSSQHPSGHEVSTVQIATKRRRYVYIVNSRGRPIEHFRIAGSTIEPLPLPNWFDEPDGLSGNSKPARTATVS